MAHVQKLPAGTDSQPGLEQSQLRRADALAAHLRQLSGAGLRGGQHRLDLVQPRPVLAGHEDALAGCVIRDACTREASLTWQPCDLSSKALCVHQQDRRCYSMPRIYAAFAMHISSCTARNHARLRAL